MVEHHPVHNSEVYLLGLPQRPSVPPPSPPSPLTPSAAEPIPIQELCLDDAAIDPSTALDSTTTTTITTTTDGSSSSSSHDSSSSSRSLVAKQRLSTAIHVLNTEATALRDLVRLYETDRVAAAGFDAAIQTIITATRPARQNRDWGRDRGSGSGGGKLVLVGVGKSGHIARKLVATFNSLGVRAAFLHPTEALHGDLGQLGPRDAVLFVTFSGRTPELLALLPHVDAGLATVVLTAHRAPEDCELVRRRPGMVLLPAPIHEPETVSFGVSAPTTSTTVALALGDALAVAAAQELHHRGAGGAGGGGGGGSNVSAVFAQNHPGGAIGAAFRKPQEIREIAVPLRNIPLCLPPAPASPLRPSRIQAAHRNGDSIDTSSSGNTTTTGADVLKAGFDSESGWVRVIGANNEEELASPSRIRGLEVTKLACDARAIPDLVVGRAEWITIRAETRIAQAAEWIRDMRMTPLRDDGGGGRGEEEEAEMAGCNERSILAVVEAGEVVGVLEAGKLLEWVD
ncbi:hypothetical protein SLS62_004105 [Diatrype stigma]|uniref:SIS domain-containing protein n=1 Tax=Diatrype stigma TaxID=117547 RepID=A0AAN9UV37_9PEZI